MIWQKDDLKTGIFYLHEITEDEEDNLSDGLKGDIRQPHNKKIPTSGTCNQEAEDLFV